MNNNTNHQSSSRNYYNNLQRKSDKNLNSSRNKGGILEEYLEIFLSKTYKYLSPIFEDNNINDNFKKEKNNNYNNHKIKEQVDRHSRSPINFIISFIKLLKNKSPNHTKNNRSKPIINRTKPNKRNNFTQRKLTNNFALNKAST